MWRNRKSHALLVQIYGTAMVVKSLMIPKTAKQNYHVIRQLYSSVYTHMN